MNKIITNKKIISGWGNTNHAKVNIAKPLNIEELQYLVSKAKRGGLLARGLGRSYGDAGILQDSTIIDLIEFKKLSMDNINNTITTQAGLSLNELLKEIIPKGYFLAVTPGTSNVSIGGAIAADVHGKNHHIDGSFGSHLKRIKLIDGRGEVRELSPELKKDSLSNHFWATVGGMGLTGVILEATFSLIPIETSLINVDTFRFNNIDDLMNAMVEADKKYKYSVAWIDSLNKYNRGVLTCGNHADMNQLNNEQKENPLIYKPIPLASAPSFLPRGLLNKLTVKAFNEAWFRKSPKNKIGELQEITPYFHPLDGIKDWNRIYGPSGFIQYQFAVPNSGSYLIKKTLDRLNKIGASSFLTVLKRFGKRNDSPLSFPISGWTLAIDIPASIPNLNLTLNTIDEEISSEGGRLYLAKDSRQTAKTFKETYPDLKKWIACKYELDPKEIFTSDLAKRIGIFE